MFDLLAFLSLVLGFSVGFAVTTLVLAMWDMWDKGGKN